MALNLDVIGKRIGPVPFTYTQDTVILYALGIGAGTGELDFVYEKNLKAFPTFAVVPFVPSFFSSFLPESGLNLYGVLHGEQKIILHKPIPVSGTFQTMTVCDSIYDKGDKGAVLNVSFETRDTSGELLFENKAVILDRTAGNFGGERGPKSETYASPEGQNPDFRVEYVTSPDQGALYRLSGDKNPLHIDPEFARKAGFARPILQGLCTFGFAGRAILHSICDGEPDRLRSFSVRFMNVVFPGDTLVTEGWQVAPGQYIVQTKTLDGRVVLGNGRAEIV